MLWRHSAQTGGEGGQLRKCVLKDKKSWLKEVSGGGRSVCTDSVPGTANSLVAEAKEVTSEEANKADRNSGTEPRMLHYSTWNVLKVTGNYLRLRPE